MYRFAKEILKCKKKKQQHTYTRHIFNQLDPQSRNDGNSSLETTTAAATASDEEEEKKTHGEDSQSIQRMQTE